jgi:hypothetical protein
MPTRTYEDVVTRARRILQDTDAASYRYSEESLADSVNDAVLELRRVRPDLFVASNFAPESIDAANFGATLLPIDDQFFMSLVYLTAGHQMLRDDEFSHDTRAVNLLNKGVAQLLKVAS